MLETYAAILVIKELLPLIFLVLVGYAYLNAYCADLLEERKLNFRTEVLWWDLVSTYALSVYRYLYYKATKRI